MSDRWHFRNIFKNDPPRQRGHDVSQIKHFFVGTGAAIGEIGTTSVYNDAVGDAIRKLQHVGLDDAGMAGPFVPQPFGE